MLKYLKHVAVVYIPIHRATFHYIAHLVTFVYMVLQLIYRSQFFLQCRVQYSGLKKHGSSIENSALWHKVIFNRILILRTLLALCCRLFIRSSSRSHSSSVYEILWHLSSSNKTFFGMEMYFFTIF